MTTETTTTFYQHGPRSFIHLKKDFVTDGSFPFKKGDRIDVKIQGDKLVITKAKKK